jgi:hypothetical protein
MRNYNYNYDDSAVSSRGSRLELWDMLSILAMLTTLCLVVYFVLVFLFPNSALNPLPPNTVNPAATITPTITPIQLQPTWTATPFVSGTETPTLVPTLTLEPSPTLLSLVTPTITFTPTKEPKRPYSATVTYIDSTIIHPDTGCNWQGIGGTLVEANNAEVPQSNNVILLSGTYNGKTVGPPGVGYMATVPGVNREYGISGWEFFLGTVPIASKGELFLQVVDPAGLPLSEKIFVDTYNDCSRNLALVRFKKNP